MPFPDRSPRPPAGDPARGGVRLRPLGKHFKTWNRIVHRAVEPAAAAAAPAA